MPFPIGIRNCKGEEWLLAFDEGSIRNNCGIIFMAGQNPAGNKLRK
jgi:hypothetical protein